MRRELGRSRTAVASAYRSLDRSRLVKGFRAHNLLAQAAALAWQLLFALVPLTLAGVAVLGFLGIEEVWRDELAEQARDSLPEESFDVLDRTVEGVLTERRGLWLTLGLLLAIWQFSAVLRTTMRLYSDVRGEKDRRPWRQRVRTSVLLSLAVLPALLAAVLSAAAGDRWADSLGLGLGALLFVVRWAIVAAILLGVLWLIRRFAPPARRRRRWRYRGPLLVIGGWIVASLLYGIYVSDVASYGSVFGGLASVIVLLGYLNILTVVFVAGVQGEETLRRRT